MNLYRIYTAICLFVMGILLALSSCTKDLGLEHQEVSVSFELSSLRGEGSISNVSKQSFVEGDRVALFVGSTASHPIVLTCQRDGSWLPKLKQEQLVNVDKLTACYPAVDNFEASQGSLTLSLPTNQSERRLFDNGDILLSQIAVSRIDKDLRMTFAHAMHCLRIHLESSDQEALPEDLKVKVRSSIQGNLSLSSGEVQNVDDMSWIETYSIGNSTYLAFVYPQALSKLKGAEGWIKLYSKGKESVFEAPSTIHDNGYLLAGHSSVVNLKVRQGNPATPSSPEEKDWRNVKQWIYGINSPVFDEKTAQELPMASTRYQPGQWINYYFGEPKEYMARLPWYEGCGWYDCNKTYWRDHDKDGRMCWAASSSNILHWWLRMNAPYVKAYDQKYRNTSYFNKFARPDASFSTKFKSHIFQMFVDNFTDRGAWEGVSWFIAGQWGGTSGCTNKEFREQFRGYFKEVFDPDNIGGMVTNYKTLNRENFNRAIKDALLHKKAVSITINNNHAMTLWGAEFDQNGEVSYIYYVDNNYGDQDEDFQGGGSCIRTQIVYKNNPGTGLREQAYMSGGKIPITAATVFDLRRKVWEKAFPNVVLSE